MQTAPSGGTACQRESFFNIWGLIFRVWESFFRAWKSFLSTWELIFIICESFFSTWESFFRAWESTLRAWEPFYRVWESFFSTWELILRVWESFFSTWVSIFGVWSCFLRYGICFFDPGTCIQIVGMPLFSRSFNFGWLTSSLTLYDMPCYNNNNRLPVDNDFSLLQQRHDNLKNLQDEFCYLSLAKTDIPLYALHDHHLIVHFYSHNIKPYSLILKIY